MGTFDRSGGHVALDFANTVSSRFGPEPVDRLAACSDLVDFGRQLGLLSTRRARLLGREARRRPAAASVAVAAAIALREGLYATFAAIAERRSPTAADLEPLNAELGRLRLAPDCTWSFAAAPGGLDQMLGPIARAAAELIVGPDRDRIGVCSAADCPFVFLDASKNRSRRWCDMASCGNRTKARRHHARTAGRRRRSELAP